MTRRPLPILFAVVVPLALAGVAVGDTDDAPAIVPRFSNLGAPSMPFVPYQQSLASTWFCAGVPAGGDGLGGSVTIANTKDEPIVGEITVFSDADSTDSVQREFEVEPRTALMLDLVQLQPVGSYLSAMVEIAGGGGIVEQKADHPDGSAVSPCSNSTSGTWYFADNYTLNRSQEDLVITNPFPDDAIVDVSFATNDGVRRPPALQGWLVAGHSVSVIDERYLAKDEAVLAVSIVASRGRVIAGRSQQYLGERQGYSMTLGSPSGSTSWTFADGERGGDTVFERYTIYNPTDDEAVVQPVFLGLPVDTAFSGVDAITVPARRVVSLNLADVPDLPDGRHSLTFSSETGTPVVVERAITRRTDDGFITSVVRGVESGFGTPDFGYYRWSMAIGSSLPVDGVLVVLNLTLNDATVAVKALGPGGEVDIPGLEALPIGPNGVVAIAIPDVPAALGVPLIVVGTQPIIVERLLPRGTNLRGRSGSLALPG